MRGALEGIGSGGGLVGEEKCGLGAGRGRLGVACLPLVPFDGRCAAVAVLLLQFC